MVQDGQKPNFVIVYTVQRVYRVVAHLNYLKRFKIQVFMKLAIFRVMFSRLHGSFKWPKTAKLVVCLNHMHTKWKREEKTYKVREKKTVPQTLINMFYSKSFERNIYLLDYFHRRLHFTGTWTLFILIYFTCIQSFAVRSLRHTFSHTHTHTPFLDDIYSTNKNARVKHRNCIRKQWTNIAGIRCTHGKNTNFPIWLFCGWFGWRILMSQFQMHGLSFNFIFLLFLFSLLSLTRCNAAPCRDIALLFTIYIIWIAKAPHRTQEKITQCTMPTKVFVTRHLQFFSYWLTWCEMCTRRGKCSILKNIVSEWFSSQPVIYNSFISPNRIALIMRKNIKVGGFKLAGIHCVLIRSLAVHFFICSSQ